ncbi:transcription factor MYB1R1-like protein [Cinnamomum micranthum f. kanehirae]|uniref:Transcription factor MYB1R1-like protein n=1 Tax=Cinnamomum micranthum f. kanehirae TaxID=337451 RepID=A0A443P8E9_9MAGN|nr:transcription factor MYB1R1-like protein [Cinnamomum micranthum f. kanehirae]
MQMARNCSQCGNNGHNSRTCEASDGGFMLFGVRVTQGPAPAPAHFQKSASMNNLSQFDHPPPHADVASGYASDDVVHAASARNRERKRGVPWTEEEHKLFLLGIQKVGKGDWRGISRNFVKTRTPTQVASHAQKYFLRRSNLHRRRRRSSLFDITTETFMGLQVEEENTMENTNNTPVTAFQATLAPTMENLTLQQHPNSPAAPKILRPTPLLPTPPAATQTPRTLNLNLNSDSAMEDKIETPGLSLELSSSPPTSSNHLSPSRHSAFQATSSFKSGDLDSKGGSIITVA